MNEMNEAQSPIKALWYSDVCAKEMNFGSRLRHINFITHKHKDLFDIVVKKFEYIKPEIDEIDCILDNFIKDCRD